MMGVSIKQTIDLSPQRIQIGNWEIDRSEPDIGYLIQITQFLHNPLTDSLAGYFEFSATGELGFDLIDEAFDSLTGNGAFCAGFPNTRQ